MEKIYIENNKQNNNKNFLHSKSVLGTFALAIIAVIAIVIVGVNQSSYAIPEVTNPLPDTFVTADIVDSETIKTSPAGAGHPVNPYKTTADTGSLRLFCMQPSAEFAGGKTYKKGEKVTDYGLLYLLAELSGKTFNDEINAVYSDQTVREAVKTWVSQVAIWMYLNDSRVTPDSAIKNYSFKEGVKEQFEGAKALTIGDAVTLYKADGTVGVTTTDTDKTFKAVYVDKLVEAAIAHKSTPNKVLKINKTDTISVTSDEKYYQTAQISVDGEENFNGYSVKLEAAPEGSFIVNANGNKLEDDNHMSGTDKFYIRVPVDKVNENNKIIKFSVTGSFTTYEGNYYKATGAQTIATVQTVTNNVQTGAEIPLNYTPDVPDTGLSTAQTVYFIGLIVLLSGIGIIYANVKPSESK